MGFLNPLLLFGLAAAAIPIAVHLFNFRRPDRIDFSTLRFVREVEATAMRRVRIRQWLLLALRTLAILLLVLAFARPTPTADASVFDEGAARSRVLLLDNSRSMTLRDAQGELLDQAKALGLAVVEAGGRGDEHTVLPVARPPEYRAVPFVTPGPALDAVESSVALPGAEPLTAALARAGSLLEGATHPRREVVVVSDLQEATFTDSASAALPPGVEVTLLPIGARRQVNTAVTDVRVVSRIVEPGRPVEVEATVTRFGGRPGTVGASLSLDGRRVAETAVDVVPDVPARVSFTVTPPARGWLGGEIRIEADAASWDDVRYFALRVPPPPRVLVVRGDGQRADLVTLALGVAAEVGGLALNEIAEGGLAGADLDRYDAVVLVGPSSVGDVGRLAQFVGAGGGVLAFPGAESEALNPLLAALGAGRIDGALGQIDGERIGQTTRPRPRPPAVRRRVRLRQPAPRVHRPPPDRALPPGRRRRDDAHRHPDRGAAAPRDSERGGERLAVWRRAGARVERPPPARPVRPAAVPGRRLPRRRVVGRRHGRPGRRLDPGRGRRGRRRAPARRPGRDGAVSAPADRARRRRARRRRRGEPGRSLPRDAGRADVARGRRQRGRARVGPGGARPRRGRATVEAATGRPVRLVPNAAALTASGESAGVPWWTICLALALACLVAETVVASRWRPASA